MFKRIVTFLIAAVLLCGVLASGMVSFAEEPVEETQYELFEAGDGKTYLYRDGEVDTAFTGLFDAGDGNRYYIVKGVWKSAFSGVYTEDGEKYYVVKGLFKPQTFIYTSASGFRYYFKNGVWQKSFTGIYTTASGLKYYIKDGIFQAGFTGIYTTGSGLKYYIREGKFQANFTGIYTTASGLKYYIKEGRMQKDFTGIYTTGSGLKYYIKNGLMQKDFTGIYTTGSGLKYYIKNGLMQKDFTGIYTTGSGLKYYIIKGRMQKDFTGIYMTSGGVRYYIENGKMPNDFTGTVEIDGLSYSVTNGIAFPILKAGDTYTLGAYEQDNDTENGKEPILWDVMDVKEGKALLVSRVVLDGKRYNDKYSKVTWETCTLRSWLNSQFMKEAFSSAEQKLLAYSVVPADNHPYYEADPGNDTIDKVFILSLSEARRYYGPEEALVCTASAYAHEHGVDVYGDNSTCYWWLRTPGYRTNTVCTVASNGYVNDFGDYVNNYGYNEDEGRNFGIRPAIWIEVGEEI